MILCDFFNDVKTAQATIISSILSALIALTVVLIDKYFENRKSNKEKYDAVKKYANPIILAAEQLAWRLKEILEFNGAFLLPNAPMNGFFKYKFDSTVYRLCSLLGWIQAAKKEQSYIEGVKNKQNKNIQHVINNFQKKLADGSHVEVSILDDLIKLFNLNQKSLNVNDRPLLGVEVEKIIFKYIPDSVKKNAILLESNMQTEMLKEIMDFICIKTNQTKIKKEVIEEKRATAINEISREFCWIYRDWQSAIGDTMIEKLTGANRRFDVIGFSDFQLKHSESFWIQKADGLFANLDVSVDDRFDSRVQQLKQVFQANLELICAFMDIVKRQETVPEQSLIDLKAFNFKINGVNLTKPKNRWKLLMSST